MLVHKDIAASYYTSCFFPAGELVCETRMQEL